MKKEEFWKAKKVIVIDSEGIAHEIIPAGKVEVLHFEKQEIEIRFMEQHIKEMKKN